VEVPDLLYVDLDSARALADVAGLGIVVVKRRVTIDWPPRSVLDQRPEPGAFLPPGEVVSVTVSKAPRCHPSYRGACLKPFAADYDCRGGSGNGPYYTGRVRVVGPDEFGLDADGDGIGCE